MTQVGGSFRYSVDDGGDFCFPAFRCGFGNGDVGDYFAGKLLLSLGRNKKAEGSGRWKSGISSETEDGANTTQCSTWCGARWDSSGDTIDI